MKDTLPPRARFRWLLITVRLSNSSLTGTARTLVAVGMVSDASMLVTTRAAAPRRGADSVSVALSGGTTILGSAIVAAVGARIRSPSGAVGAASGGCAMGVWVSGV